MTNATLSLPALRALALVRVRSAADAVALASMALASIAIGATVVLGWPG
ncbi:MAG TPA: hypothetical protein VFQ55_17300 [Casimicrobiaceae bacterium]|jgi:hypothetical protein|nr:hypothetical protein [Casimicrobiaceae bacterium]